MRLLIYNIHKGIGNDRRYRLERTMEVIEHENPDLICLQEVDRGVRRSSFDDQPRLLADRFCSIAHCFQLNVHLRTGGYGNLVLSRWPIADRHHVSLRLKWRKARGAQLVTVDTPEGLLRVVHWHLGLSERERLWQASHLIGHPLFREASELPTLIVGDSNDWRNRLEKDCFEKVGFQLATSPPSRFRTFPSLFPVASLDKLYWRGDIQIVGTRVVRSAKTRRASDHLPVVIDFHLTDRALTPNNHTP